MSAFGRSKSYSRMENTSHEYAGSRIGSGGNTNVTAEERDLTVKGSTVTGRDVSLTAKGKDFTPLDIEKEIDSDRTDKDGKKK